MTRRRKKYKATHAVQLYDSDIVGMDQGFRCVHLLQVKRVWVYLVDTAPSGEDGVQRLRKCDVDLWKKLTRKGWELDRKGRPLVKPEKAA